MIFLEKKHLLLSKKKRRSFCLFFRFPFSFFFGGFLGSIKCPFLKRVRKLVLKKKKSFFFLKSFSFFTNSLYSFKKFLHLNFIGCCFGWFVSMEFSGRGYFVVCSPTFVKLYLGLSHGVGVAQPFSLSLLNNKKFKSKIFLHSINLVFLKNFSFKVRSLRPLDSYKGRGIKYSGEIIKLKVGKRAF